MTNCRQGGQTALWESLFFLVTTEILICVNCESQTKSTAHTCLFSPSHQYENMQFTSFIRWVLTVAAVIDSDSPSGVSCWGDLSVP